MRQMSQVVREVTTPAGQTVGLIVEDKLSYRDLTVTCTNQSSVSREHNSGGGKFATRIFLQKGCISFLCIFWTEFWDVHSSGILRSVDW
jgi:hypothetical protein